MATRRDRLQAARKSAGHTQESLAHACDVDRSTVARWERGAADPQPWQHTKIALALNMTLSEVGDLLDTPTPVLSPALVVPASGGLVVPSGNGVDLAEPLRDKDISDVRDTMTRLLALDGQCGGAEAAQQGLRVFRALQRRIGAAPCPPELRSDLYAAVGELAEIVGWLLYDANNADMRAISLEALAYSDRAGDRSVSLLTRQNLAMHAEWITWPVEALAIVDRVLETEKLSPRLESLFRARRAHALALQGLHTDARRELDRARSLFADGTRDTDPAWAWWVDERQWDWFTAMVHSRSGDRDIPVDAFARALDTTPSTRTRGRYSYSAYLFGALIDARQWTDAHRIADQLPALIAAVGSGSGRTSEILRRVLKKIRRSDAPASIQDTADELAALLSQLAA